MKTLKELWDENGQKPFDAIVVLVDDGKCHKFHCTGISPSGAAVGWKENGTPDQWNSGMPFAQLDKPPEPRFLAYHIKIRVGGEGFGIRFEKEGVSVPPEWNRAPWLDEPEKSK